MLDLQLEINTQFHNGKNREERIKQRGGIKTSILQLMEIGTM